MPSLEEFRTKAFFRLLGEASDLPPRVMGDKFENAGLKSYRDYLAATDKLTRIILREGFGLEEAKTQASVMILARVMDWEPKPLARRLMALNIRSLDDLSQYVTGKGFESFERKYKKSVVHHARQTAWLTLQAMVLDLWPGPAAIADFWLTDQEHYEALYYPIRRSEITVEDLNEVLGDPKAITELVNSMPSNPHKGIVFGDAPPGAPGNGWEPTRN